MNCGGAGKGETPSSVSAPASAVTASRLERSLVRDFFLRLGAARSSRCARTINCPSAPAAGRASSSATRSSSRCRNTARPPKWRSRSRPGLRSGSTRRERCCPKDGRFLVCRKDGGEVQVFPIERGWTRIGRSANADIRLDDPSVSRRHALIVSELPDSLRVLDDRSLNGVFLNGEIVDWGRLADGDELAIGRFHLFALER